MKKICFTFLILLFSCTKGPLHTVDQARNSGGWFTSFSNRVVLDSQLVTDGERFYYGTSRGHVFSINVKNLRKDWMTTLPGSVDTSILADEARVYAGTSKGFIHGLDKKSGKSVWSMELSAPPRGIISKFGTTIFVGTNDGVLYALNCENGKTLWKYRHEPYEKMKIEFFIQGNVDQNRLFVGFPNGQLSALNIETGAEVWKQWATNPQSRFYDVSSILLIPQKGVLVTSVDGASTMFSLDGTQLWSVEGISTQAAAVLSGDRILIAAKSRLVWLDTDGQEKTSLPYGRSIRPAGVAYANGMILISSLDGSLHVFDEKTSAYLWEYQMGISIQGAPILLNDKIWVLTRRGQIIGMEVKK